jgi:hypothetical protein
MPTNHVRKKCILLLSILLSVVAFSQKKQIQKLVRDETEVMAFVLADNVYKEPQRVRPIKTNKLRFIKY